MACGLSGLRAEPGRSEAVRLETASREETMRTMILAVPVLCLFGLGSLTAYAQAPAAGSGAAGGVGPSVNTPRTAQGNTPPGTPSADTAGDRALRDAAGQNALGKIGTPSSALPGDTTGQDSGVRK